MAKHGKAPWRDGEGLSRGRFIFDADDELVVQVSGKNHPVLLAAAEMLSLLCEVTALCDNMKIGGISTGCGKCWACRKRALVQRVVSEKG